MYWLTVVGIAFVLITLAELGDKTQLMTVTLASKYPRMPVYWGVLLGMAFVTLLGVAVGTIIYSYIPVTIVKIIAGSLFIFFGIYTFLLEDDDAVEDIDEKHVFRNSFTLSMIAEFGDKTQLAVIALTARYASPSSVFIGAVMGLALIVGIGTLLGDKISQVVERDKIELGAAILFVVLGVFFIVEALL